MQDAPMGLGYITRLFEYIIQGMKIPLHVWSFEFSLWEVFVFVIIVGLVCSLIGEMLNGK